MKLPLSWLKEYINISYSTEDLSNILTMAGLEVDEIVETKAQFENVVVGKVLATEQHPNADKLCIAKVSNGHEEVQVVCGASNCREGLITAFAPVGAKITDTDGKAFKIRKSTLRGVESFGMLCSADELQVGEADGGILELPKSSPLGEDLAHIYTDKIIEISLTPNLNYCSSILGVARELSALTEKGITPVDYQIQSTTTESIHDWISVQIENKEHCPRYACRVIKDVKIEPSPLYLQQRLKACGIRPVNNVVDITNYVLMEFGHPLHAFDYDKLRGKCIVVKNATEGESFKTLDDNEHQLSAANLMICDEEGPVAIAGVMGGQNSEVSDETVNVLLEAAYFHPSSVRKTSKQLGIQSESSKRFERGCDPNQLLTALNRAASLIEELANGTVLEGVVDVSNKQFPTKTLICRLSRVNEILGTQLSLGEVENIFERLHFTIEESGDGALSVQIPTYRVDLHLEIDLIEEVARIYGYHNITTQMPLYRVGKHNHTPMYTLEKKVRRSLVGERLQEFITCDLINPSSIAALRIDSFAEDALISVKNPSSAEQSLLRPSLLPGIVQLIKHNYKHNTCSICGFEIGQIFYREEKQYKEQTMLSLVMTGNLNPEHWQGKNITANFFEIKGSIENLLEHLGIQNAEFKASNFASFHPGRQASVLVNGLRIGTVGQIHPAIQREYELCQPFYFAELNLHDLLDIHEHIAKYTALSIYPCSERDWTVTISDSTTVGTILEHIRSISSTLLEEVHLLSVYRNEKLGDHCSNLTFRFTYRDPKATLSYEAVEAEHARLVSDCEQMFIAPENVVN